MTRASGAFAAWLALAGCREPAPPPAPMAASAPSSAPVRWRAAGSPVGAALLEAPARVTAAADGRAVVTPPMRARVVAVLAVAGREVAAGAPVVEVALPEAAAAAAAYLAAADQLAAHDRRAQQLEALRGEGLARTAELAAVELERARLRGERDVAATTLRAAGLAVGDAADLAARGGRTTLRAPRAGLIVRASAVVGAPASPDEPLVEIAGGGSRRIEATLAYPLPEGAQFEVDLAGAPGVRVALVAIAPAREADGTSRAWFDAKDPLPAGALGKLRAFLPAGAAATVPAAAIGRDGAGTFVWRQTSGPPARVAVRVLATSGAEALVAGVSEGDAIASVAQAVAPAAAAGAP